MARMTHREPEWIPTAPVQIRRTQRIDAPPAAVWAFIAAHESWPAWFTLLDRVEVTGMDDRVGGTRDVSGGGVTFSEVFTAWEPDERFAFTVVDGPRMLASMAESITITDVDEQGCTVEYVQGLEFKKGFGFLATPMAKRLGAGLEAGLAGLKEAAESVIA